MILRDTSFRLQLNYGGPKPEAVITTTIYSNSINILFELFPVIYISLAEINSANNFDLYLLPHIEHLKEMALPERWYYSHQNPNYPYPILVSYLKYTFYKLRQEGSKIIESENYAAFNTGLVDRRYEPIFALFSKTPNALRNWKLENFCIAGEEREGKELVRQFNPLPKRAHYADKVVDMLYDTLAPKPELDWHHIVVENVDRLPIDFLEDNCPKNFQLKQVVGLDCEERELYYSALSQAIKEDTKTYRNITNRFKDALELSLKRIEWNFKTAIAEFKFQMQRNSY